MQNNYDIFFDELIKHERGITDDERDPGNQWGDGHGNRGSTNLGVTAIVWAAWKGKPAPIEVMKQLTKKRHKAHVQSQVLGCSAGRSSAFWCGHLSR